MRPGQKILVGRMAVSASTLLHRKFCTPRPAVAANAHAPAPLRPAGERAGRKEIKKERIERRWKENEKKRHENEKRMKKKRAEAGNEQK